MTVELGIRSVGARLWCRVAVQDVDTDEMLAFTIVPPHLAEPSDGRVSAGSPLAVALVGHNAGDSIRVELKDGTRIFRVLHVACPQEECDEQA